MTHSRITQKGIQYSLTYTIICLLPFLFFLNKEGMTAIIAKTIGFITLPISLLIWLFDLEIFHKFFITHIGINVILNILILFWIGSLVERKNQN